MHPSVATINHSDNHTYAPRSKLLRELSSFRSAESPSLPNIVIYTLASVPPPRLLPVNTVTLYLFAEKDKNYFCCANRRSQRYEYGMQLNIQHCTVLEVAVILANDSV